MGDGLFDLSAEYDEMLNRGIRLSGETRHFFIVGRVQALCRHLPQGWQPRRILDFGCGIGSTSQHLAEVFPHAEVVGVDTSAKALSYARATCGSSRVSFELAQTFSATEAFDLCYSNGVFHHIRPQDRPEAVKRISRALVPRGYVALFENNPWNPGTRLVMRRIPFDRGTRPLSPPEARRLLHENGIGRCLNTCFLFYFPRPLAFLRWMEPCFARLPLGAQYCVLAIK